MDARRVRRPRAAARPRASFLCDIHRMTVAGCALDSVVKSARSVFFSDEACGKCERPGAMVAMCAVPPIDGRRLTHFHLLAPALNQRATLHSRRQRPLDSVSTTLSTQSAETLCRSDRRPG